MPPMITMADAALHAQWGEDTVTSRFPTAPHDRPLGVEHDPGLPDGIPAVSLDAFLAAVAQALDLAEGRRKGHALRVCYTACAVARQMALARAQASTVFFAALLHDIGVPRASERLCDVPRLSEHELFAALPLHNPDLLAAQAGGAYGRTVTDALHDHTFEGASAAASLGLPPQVAEAVLYHHERHDGGGFPMGLAGGAIPLAARIVAAADYAEALVAAEPNPLLARRYLEASLREQAGRAFHPEVVDALVSVARRDEFWLVFHDRGLLYLTPEFSEFEGRPLGTPALLRVAGAFADIADAKNAYKRGHSRRVARCAAMLATRLGCGAARAQAVEMAALLHDIGMLKVPGRVTAKPEILSLQEMSLLREHPTEGAQILRDIPGWEPLAAWVAAHHERYDGRGYPEGLAGEDVPLEARILAVADIYEALTADRPHRPALTPVEAVRAMGVMVGAEIDPLVFSAFESAIVNLDDLTDDLTPTH